MVTHSTNGSLVGCMTQRGDGGGEGRCKMVVGWEWKEGSYLKEMGEWDEWHGWNRGMGVIWQGQQKCNLL